MNLETERLLLRPFTPEDFADFYEYVSDRDLCLNIGWYNIVDEESAKKVFDGMVERGNDAIVLKKTGKVIGNFTAAKPHPFIARHEALQGMDGVSMSFAVSAQHQRKGYVSEMMAAVLRHLFTVENKDYANCGNFDFNTASAKVQEKFGFHYLGQHGFNPQAYAAGKDMDAPQITIQVIENVLYREEYLQHCEK